MFLVLDVKIGNCSELSLLPVPLSIFTSYYSQIIDLLETYNPPINVNLADGWEFKAGQRVFRQRKFLRDDDLCYLPIELVQTSFMLDIESDDTTDLEHRWLLTFKEDNNIMRWLFEQSQNDAGTFFPKDTLEESMCVSNRIYFE